MVYLKTRIALKGKLNEIMIKCPLKFFRLTRGIKVSVDGIETQSNQ